jgi:hypothetical protein
MPPLDADARIKFFADLRPVDSYMHDLSRHGRGIVEVVPLAIVEEPGTMNGQPSTGYLVVELDRDGSVVVDWTFWELDQALAEIGEFPNSEWETVKLADSDGCSGNSTRPSQRSESFRTRSGKRSSWQTAKRPHSSATVSAPHLGDSPGLGQYP